MGKLGDGRTAGSRTPHVHQDRRRRAGVCICCPSDKLTDVLDKGRGLVGRDLSTIHPQQGRPVRARHFSRRSFFGAMRSFFGAISHGHFGRLLRIFLNVSTSSRVPGRQLVQEAILSRSSPIRVRFRGAVIGHMKAEGHLGRCYLKARAGDAANAILSAVGYNLRLLLAWLRMILRVVLLALVRTLAIQPAVKSAYTIVTFSPTVDSSFRREQRRRLRGRAPPTVLGV